jgi:uncharacterized repeat protein (TIGR03803 family)
MDKRGNLYSTTPGGGLYASGAAFELTPPSTFGGSWSESILWNFGSGTDGIEPQAGLIIDASGNLYGTTFQGGIYNFGEGTVFKLTPPSAPWESWTESILWNFGNGSDGFAPVAGLLADKRGNLYGTTLYGGAYDCFSGECFGGTAFKLTPPSTSWGSWDESVLWSFGDGADGENPFAGLIAGPRGDLYGTTGYGGIYTWGTVFELSLPGWGQ